jgi:chemotaxis response regulator CheB
MPKEAIKLGAVDKIAPLQKIPESIFAFVNDSHTKKTNQD